MIHNVKTLTDKPAENRYPIYLRDAAKRWYIKLLSDQQVVWLYIIDTPGWKSFESGKRVLTNGEYFDVPYLTHWFDKSREDEYLSKLESLFNHYEKVKERLIA